MKLYADMLTGFHYVTECPPAEAEHCHLIEPFGLNPRRHNQHGVSSNLRIQKRIEKVVYTGEANESNPCPIAGISSIAKRTYHDDDVFVFRSRYVETGASSKLEFLG